MSAPAAVVPDCEPLLWSVRMADACCLEGLGDDGPLFFLNMMCWLVVLQLVTELYPPFHGTDGVLYDMMCGPLAPSSEHLEWHYRVN